jgi:predicted ABC-type ATPase
MGEAERVYQLCRHACYRPAMPWRMEVALFVGVQGSGKTSFYASQLIHTHLRISRDLVRTKHREWKLFEACLDLQQPLVLDNTNPSRAVRARFIALAQARGFPVVAWHFEVPLADALARNALREGKQRIPDNAVESTFARLQPPQLDEGFERVFVVRVLADAPGQPRYRID